MGSSNAIASGSVVTCWITPFEDGVAGMDATRGSKDPGRHGLQSWPMSERYFMLDARTLNSHEHANGEGLEYTL